MTPSERIPRIVVSALKVHFPVRQGLVLALMAPQKRRYIRAVDGIDLSIAEDEVLGLAGESGCGKTTTGRVLVRLENPTGGTACVDGQDIGMLRGGALKNFRRTAQMVFQDPYDSLNPRFTVRQTLEEPLKVHAIGTKSERQLKVAETLDRVGLSPPARYWDSFPHQLSGGQRQRLSFARAIVLGPRFLVADEPVSMLDVSIRAGILRLIEHETERLKLATLLISHDISTLRYLSRRIAVMYLGRIVEVGRADEVVDSPKHPYTQALIRAVLEPEFRRQRKPLLVTGDIPSAMTIPMGCRFRSRCPLAMPVCAEIAPPAVTVGHDHIVECHLYPQHSEPATTTMN